MRHARPSKVLHRSFSLAAGLWVFGVAQVPFDSSGAPRIRLKGAARIEAVATRTGGQLSVSGVVTDDAGEASPQRLEITLERPVDALDLPLTPFECVPPPPLSMRAVLESPTHVTLRTDDRGRFCVRFAATAGSYTAHLSTEATPFLDPTHLDLPSDPSLRPATLRFDPVPSVLMLDGDTGAIDVVASADIDGAPSRLAGAPLRLSNEVGATVADAVTDSDGRAHFVLSPARIGPVGRGELRAVLAGWPGVSTATARASVERRTRVAVRARDARATVLPGATADESIPVHVAAEAGCALGGCRCVPTGIVEARVQGTVVGAAPLEDAQATLAVTLPAGDSRQVAIELRYIPDAPWLLDGGPTVVMQPLRPPAPWAKIAMAASGAVLLSWVVLARARLARPPERGSASTLRGAGAWLVTTSPPHTGWKGVVIDAHERVAVAGARLAVHRPGFSGSEVLAQTAADAAGEFHLPPVDIKPGDRWVVTASLHATLRQAVPGHGTLQVAMVLRRRALVASLVSWARARGGRFGAFSEPTPAQVRSAATDDPQIARWAEAIERVAFGPSAVDAQAVSEVNRLAPPDLDEDDMKGAEHVDGARPRSV